MVEGCDDVEKWAEVLEECETAARLVVAMYSDTSWERLRLYQVKVDAPGASLMTSSPTCSSKPA